MFSLNKVMLVGEVSEKPELRYTPEGTAVACFSVTISRPATAAAKSQKEAETFSVVAWRELAEYSEAELDIGTPIHLEGRLRNHVWRDMVGRQILRTEIIAERILIIEQEEDYSSESRYDYDYQWRE